MAKTILITGCGSGIGLATAQFFLQKKWDVIATDKDVKDIPLSNSSNCFLYDLDVTDVGKVHLIAKQILQKHSVVDVVVNNAGFGLLGPFELLTQEQRQKQFDVNFFGVCNVTEAFLEHFKANKKGLFINMSSMFGKISMPYFSMYAATKWAVEGFSECLQQEVASMGIRVKLIEPGNIKTQFLHHASRLQLPEESIYFDRYTRFMRKIDEHASEGVSPEVVGRLIFKAATDNNTRFRYKADWSTWYLVTMRKLLPLSLYSKFIKRAMA